MALRYRECFGEVFRFQIINGTLWVDHISERHSGWYPSRMGAGETLDMSVAGVMIFDLSQSLQNVFRITKRIVIVWQNLLSAVFDQGAFQQRAKFLMQS